LHVKLAIGGADSAAVAVANNTENTKTLPYWTRSQSEESEYVSAKFYARY
jgi:hypothetical protein